MFRRKWLGGGGEDLDDEDDDEDDDHDRHDILCLEASGLEGDESNWKRCQLSPSTPPRRMEGGTLA